MKILNVLIACEESQAVCKEFRALGHNAFSCDIEPCSGVHPEYHIQSDVLPLLDGSCTFLTQSPWTTKDGNKLMKKIKGEWDLIVAFPPCTYLTVTGNRWFNVEKYGEKAIQRHENRKKAVNFFMTIANANCKHIAIENPVGHMSTAWRKPDQIIQPYMFGDAIEKKTCLFLKNLPQLNPTQNVEPPKRKKFESGKTMPEWYADLWHLPPKERAAARSKTFPGVAKAMAAQWSEYLCNS